MLQATERLTVNDPIPGSVAFVPSVAGLIIAGEVVKDLCKEERQRAYEHYNSGIKESR